MWKIPTAFCAYIEFFRRLLARASFTESTAQHGHLLVEPPTQRFAWQPCRGGGRLAGVGLILTLGSRAGRGKCRRISYLAGAHHRAGVGLGHPVAWPGESCLAHRHDGSVPLDYDRADRRTIGNDALSCSDRTRLSCLLDHLFLWILQTSPSVHYRSINRCNREPSIYAVIRTPPQKQITPTTFRSDQHQYRTSWRGADRSVPFL